MCDEKLGPKKAFGPMQRLCSSECVAYRVAGYCTVRGGCVGHNTHPLQGESEPHYWLR